MSSLHGLPPLPKSLSGFNLLDGQTKPPTPVRTTSMRQGHLVYPPHPKINGKSNLDTQLAILRREMVSWKEGRVKVICARSSKSLTRIFFFFFYCNGRVRSLPPHHVRFCDVANHWTSRRIIRDNNEINEWTEMNFYSIAGRYEIQK